MSKAETPDPDDTGKHVVDKLRKTVSTHMPAITDTDIATSHIINVLRETMEVFDTLAGKMLDVVKAININESRQADNEKRFKRMLWGVWAAVAVNMLATVMAVLAIGDELDIYAVSLENRLDEMKQTQDATLGAVLALSEALGKNIEAERTLDPDVEEQAAAAALEAQKKTLQAQKKIADTPAAKKAVADKIDKVDKKASAKKRQVPEEHPFE